ncbi:MAG: hypothetical protein AB1465_04875 [Patescibacteria group bacterium]
MKNYNKMEKLKLKFKNIWEKEVLKILDYESKKMDFKILNLPKKDLVKRAPLLIEKITKNQFKNKISKCQLAFFSGANGVGKNTIMTEVMKKIKAKKLPYAYTRARRSDEIDRIDYYFWDDKKFDKTLKEKKFLWYDLNHHGKKQGLLKKDFNNFINRKEKFVLDARVLTTKFLLEKVPKIKNSNYISFYILPPSFDEWYRRLTNRSQSFPSEDVIERIEISLKELAKAKKICEVFIVNNKVKRAVKEILKFYTLKERL